MPLMELYPPVVESSISKALLVDQARLTAREPTGAHIPITEIVPYTPVESLPVTQDTEETVEPVDATVGVQRTIKLWAKGSDVRALQKQLTALGYKLGKADGVYGTKTYKAVIRFQKQYGLVPDGIVGEETRMKMQELGIEIPLYYAYEAEFPQGFTRKLSMGKVGMDVRMLQLELIKLGYLEGGADQVFGKKTRTAVRKFQRDNELMVDGIAGVDTLRMLFPDGIASE